MVNKVVLLITIAILVSGKVVAQTSLNSTQVSIQQFNEIDSANAISDKSKIISMNKGRRFNMGLNLGIFQLGLHSRFTTRLGQWRYGEYGYGVKLAMHRFILDFDEQKDVKRSSVDETYRFSAVFAHSFLFFKRRLNIDHFVYAGPSIRRVKSSLKNERYGIEAKNNYIGTFWESGVGMSIGYRFTKHWGISVDGVLPLVVSGRDTLLQYWLLSTPYTGLSVLYQY